MIEQLRIKVLVENWMSNSLGVVKCFENKAVVFLRYR